MIFYNGQKERAGNIGAGVIGLSDDILSLFFGHQTLSQEFSLLMMVLPMFSASCWIS